MSNRTFTITQDGTSRTFSVNTGVGPAGAAGANGLAYEVKSSSFTAASNGVYTAVATLTVTDPTPAEGLRFTVHVRSGTATVGGVAYATAGTMIERIYHSGAWTNSVYLSNLDSDLSTFSLPANTTISTFGATLVASASASAARTALVLDINQSDSESYEAGSISTAASEFAEGGFINTSASGFSAGGNITTAGGGGSIDTTGTGSIEFGVSETRTTLSGTATTARAISLPDADGTLALTSDITAGNATTIATALNAGTERTTAADSDKIAVTSPAGGWMSLTTLWTWISTKLAAITSQTIGGVISFSSTTRPTSSGSGEVAATSLITLTDSKTENHFTRNLFRMATGSVSGTGTVARRAVSQGIIDGDCATTTSAGAFYKITLVGAGGSLQGNAISCVDLSSSWQFMLRMSMRMASSNGHLLFCVGADGASGVPSSGVNVGFEITSQTSVRLWRCNSGAAVYSSAGTISNASAATKTHDHFFWLVNSGSGTLSLYYANKTFAAVNPARPASPICTLSGVASGGTGSTLPAIFLRSIDTPLGNVAELLLRDASFTEY